MQESYGNLNYFDFLEIFLPENRFAGCILKYKVNNEDMRGRHE